MASVTWAWRASVTPALVKDRIATILAGRGFAPAKPKSKLAIHVSVYADGRGALVLGWSAGGFSIAQDLSRALDAEATFAEVELLDRRVAASSRPIASDGSGGATTNHDNEATDLAEEWHEGKKYRSEAADDLAAIFAGVEDGCPKTAEADFAFDRVTGNARVQHLVDVVRAGARWEKTSISGRVAIRITDSSGTRMSVLDDAELAEFEREVS
jgi:hypothetical protein